MAVYHGDTSLQGGTLKKCSVNIFSERASRRGGKSDALFL